MGRLAARVGDCELEVELAVGDLALANERPLGHLLVELAGGLCLDLQRALGQVRESVLGPRDAEAVLDRLPAAPEPKSLRQAQLRLLDLRRAGLDLERQVRLLRGGVGDRDPRPRLGGGRAASLDLGGDVPGLYGAAPADEAGRECGGGAGT